jgi:uncharacterized protein (TIGR00290 family)
MNEDGNVQVVLSWSGGKDSALALYELQQRCTCKLVGLLTSVAQPYRRVSHHGVREELLVRQAEAIGLPLHIVYLPTRPDLLCTNSVYEQCMDEALCTLRAQGVTAVAFGDIFLEDLRRYRERQLARLGLQGLFPLWKRDTAQLARQFVQLGFRAIVTSVVESLGPERVGQRLTEAWIDALPPGCDPCGENGEYHSFVYDGPGFRYPVPVRVGECVARDGRFFAELLPDGNTPKAVTSA